MSKTTYPRVLIIGQTFAGISGASITLRNLFKGWPAEKLAVASMNINEFDVTALEYCANNYKLGKSEIQVLSVINIFFPVGDSKIITTHRNCTQASSKSHFVLKSRIKTILKKGLIITGLNSIRIKYDTSDSFKQWYDEFNPQIIYSALGDLDLIQFVLKIKKLDQVPIALHIWDDWPNTLFERTIFKKYWKKKFDTKFRDIISHAQLLLSISEGMTEAYKDLYGYEFISFHNPIDIGSWNQEIVEKKGAECKQVLYVGKINKDTIDLLLMMSKLVETMIVGFDLKFTIYSPNGFKFERSFKKYSKTKLLEAIPHEKIIRKIKSAGLLFLPLGFSKKSVNYTKYSMPTKASEYMISRVPIIVMAPASVELTKYAKKQKWAEVVDSNDIEALRNSVRKLCLDIGYRTRITDIAYNLGIERHNAINVRRQFQYLLNIKSNNE